MKTPLLVVAGVLAGMAAGVVVGKAGSGSGKQEADGPEVTRSGAGSRTGASRPSSAGGVRGDSPAEAALADLLNGRSAAEMTAAEAYELFGPFLRKGQTGDRLERAKAEYQFRLLASKLPLPVLEELIVLAKKDDQPDFEVGLLFGAMADRDWDRAVGLARKNGSPMYWASDAIAGIAVSDPERALELYRKTSLEANWPDGNTPAAMALAKSLGSRSRADFYKFLDETPAAMRTTLLMISSLGIPKENIPAIIEELKDRAAADPMYQSALGSIMLSNRIDAETRREWLDTNPPGMDRANADSFTASRLFAQGKKADAEELMKSALSRSPAGGKDIVKGKLIHDLRNQPEQADWLVALLPDDQRFTPADFLSFNYNPMNNPGNVVDVARGLRTDEDRASYLEARFEKLGEQKLTEQEFRLFSNRIDALGLTGANGEKARAALESAREKSLGKK